MSTLLGAALLAELDPFRNLGVDISRLSIGSQTKVWWICGKGHSYATTPAHRSRGQGCPYCGGRRALAGFNDLATESPALAAEWHPTLNGAAQPTEFTSGSGVKEWWLGVCGHEWEATINNRSNGTGCPYCAGVRVLIGFNDLAHRLPKLAAQWDARKNSSHPDEVSPYSNKSAWWLCDHGHSWEANISNRANGNGCPICAGQFAQFTATTDDGSTVQSAQRVVRGVNDMATTQPDLAGEFALDLNAPLVPTKVPAGTGKKLWWRCALGHTWRTTGNSRTTQHTGCPTCSGQRVEVGFNDLGTAAPEVAATWHPTRNRPLTARDVTVKNGKKCWWQCVSGHEWETTVASRTSGTGCPVCAGQVVLTGVSDLATLRPSVAATWHPTRNGSRLPTGVAQYSNQIVWWQCEHDHEWESTINNRSHGQGCPMCAERGFKPSRPGYVYFIHNRQYGAFKVGITNVGTNRLATFQKDGWEVLHLHRFDDGAQAMSVETAVHRWWRKDLGLPAWLTQDMMSKTGGWSETISAFELTAPEITARIEAEAAARVVSLADGSMPR